MKISVLEIFRNEKTKKFYNLCNKKRRLRQKCTKVKIIVYNAKQKMEFGPFLFFIPPYDGRLRTLFAGGLFFYTLLKSGSCVSCAVSMTLYAIIPQKTNKIC